MMNKLFLLVALFLVACGGEEPTAEKCLGPVGKFEGKCSLSINNCSNPVYSHGMRMLVVDEDNTLRECGEHILEYSVVDDPITKCKIHYTKSVTTKSTGYVGAMKGEVDCTDIETIGGKCLSFWEVHFRKVE
jgi:hypothetical protein